MHAVAGPTRSPCRASRVCSKKGATKPRWHAKLPMQDLRERPMQSFSAPDLPTRGYAAEREFPPNIERTAQVAKGCVTGTLNRLIFCLQSKPQILVAIAPCANSSADCWKVRLTFAKQVEGESSNQIELKRNIFSLCAIGRLFLRTSLL